jgi:hypothetical protein
MRFTEKYENEEDSVDEHDVANERESIIMKIDF